MPDISDARRDGVPLRLFHILVVRGRNLRRFLPILFVFLRNRIDSRVRFQSLPELVAQFVHTQGV